MDRRSFIKWLAAGAAALGAAGELDPEKLLWRPGAKKIFLPSEFKAPVVIGADDPESLVWILSNHYEVTGKRVTFLEHVVHTAVGTVVSDAAWNVKTVNGRPVPAKEAATLRLTHFSRYPRHVSFAELDQATARVISERVAAGWDDPVGDGGHWIRG